MSAGVSGKLITIEELRPQSGQIVESWVTDKLLPFLRQREIVSISPGGDISINPTGTRVHYQGEDEFRGRFIVLASDAEVRVSAGLVNDEYMPSIGGVHLDGTDAETEQLTDAPSLEIDIPESDGYSFVCVSLLTDGSGVPLIDVPDWLTIEHITDLALARRERPETGFQPLARLRWEGGRLLRYRQIVYHDLVHFYVPASGDRPGFHHFDGI